MPRALPASARSDPPATSPPLVALSRRSSVSTIAERKSLERIKSRGASPDALQPRSGADDMAGHGGEATYSSAATTSRRSFELGASPNGALAARRNSYRRPSSNRNSGLFDVSDNEDEEPAGSSRSRSRDQDMAASPPPLSSMSLHHVGQRSSFRAPSATGADSSTSPPRSAAISASSSAGERARHTDFERKISEWEKGHRTMLSSGSVRSIGRRSSVNSYGSDNSAPHSPYIQSGPLPSLASRTAALSSAETDNPSTPSSTSSSTPTLPVSQPETRKLAMHKLLEQLLPPGAAEYPHAPGHDTPHAFEEGCSHPPSPRPQNHYRHDRDGPEWKPSKLGEEALQAAQEELGTPRWVREGQELATPRSQGKERQFEEATPRAAPSSAAMAAEAGISPADSRTFRVEENGAASPSRPGSARPALSPSTTAPPSFLPLRVPTSLPSASSRPAGGARNASYAPVSMLGTLRPSIASAIRERRRQASLMTLSFPGSLSASSSLGEVGEYALAHSESSHSLASSGSGAAGERALGQPWQGSAPVPSEQDTGPPLSPRSLFSNDSLQSQSQSQQGTRRIRSRGPTRMGLGDLPAGQDFATVNSKEPFARALQQGLERGMIGDVVMTPTTEEWHQLGGLPGEMRKFRDDPRHDSEEDPDSGSSDEEPDDSIVVSSNLSSLIDAGARPPGPADSTVTPAGGLQTPAPSSPTTPSAHSIPQHSPTASFRGDDQPTPTKEPPGFMPAVSSMGTTQIHQAPVHGIIESPSDMRSIPMLSAMSTQSINSVTSISSDSTDSSEFTLGSIIMPMNQSPRAVRNGVPLCSLLHDGIVQGPVDPRVYSAMTGRRNIGSFLIEADAGKGAYGLVRRAREKGPEGQPVGPELIIKYIVKQKILADCWKKHRVLGPIPIEIHVLDHLRRVPYRPSLTHVASKVHRRPPSRRASTFGPAAPPSHTLGGNPLANGDPRTGHPNICGILDYFEDTDYYYMVMPCFGAGQDLFDYVDLAPDGLPLHEVRSIFGQVADAVAFLHEHNIVHRDIKDENVILDGFGNVQLIDFGSAAYIREGKLFDTFSGTLDFAAPEVLRGERHGGKEIDVWALGVLLYVLICGECPFWSSTEAAQGIERSTRAFKALEAKMRSLKEHTPTADAEMEKAVEDLPKPDDLFDLVCRCLSIDSRDRPSSQDLCRHRLLAGPGGWVGKV